MNEFLCTLRGFRVAVSEEDPDAAIDEAVTHARRAHGFDPREGFPKSMRHTFANPEEPTP